jgi:S-adenosylmethionine hydrolase
MAVVTLLSDFGDGDFYLGAVKGELLQLCGTDCVIVDIHHGLLWGEYMRAGMMTQGYWNHFPKGTIHIHALTPKAGDYAHVCFSEEGHFFLGTDIGQFSLVFPSRVEPVADISHVKGGDGTFPALSLFPKIVKLLLDGNLPQSWQVPNRELTKFILQDSNFFEKQLRGMVTYIDEHGNAHTNIHRDMFDRVFGDRPFRIIMRQRSRAITKIHKRYSEVNSGDLVAVFNHRGFLELSQNCGNFCRFVGASLNESVIIEFS